jgi:predicted metal-dependent phosphoesterase TrpH
MGDEDGFTIRVDLHVHTRRYSPCAEGLDPAQLADCLAPARLHGMVITEHDHLWSWDEITALNRLSPYGRIYRGIEVSSCNGHFILIGLDRQPPPPAGISVRDLLDYLHPSDAAVIWVHPYLNYGSTSAALTADMMPQGIHALEVASSITIGEQSRHAHSLAHRRGWAAVGGSDAHTIGQVGCAYTLLRELPADEKALAHAIRQGACRAVHGPSDTQTGRHACC